jgi:formylglycine-generating enzyme required for sulfatase activity
MFVKATGHLLPEHWSKDTFPEDKDDHPVVLVSWYDALAYCQWLSDVTGKNYSLPSEAEWEKGARGMNKWIYPWGDQWDWRRCNSGEGGPTDTTPVGVYLEGASPYGALDVIGNVWEWTRTIFRPYPYNAEDGREILETHDDVQRVLRGGSFSSYLSRVRTAYRLWSNPMQYCRWDVGFRVVLRIMTAQ